MGRPKLTLQVEGVPMLQRVLTTLGRSKVDRVVVVLGSNAAEVKRSVKFIREVIVVNRHYADGMSSSLKLGLGEVSKEADAAIIVLGDQPFVSAKTIDRLVDAYKASGARVVVPVYRGARGNPVLFDRRMFGEITGIQGDVGAKSVVAGSGENVLEVAVEDDGVLVDIDTPSDYEREAARGTRRSRE